MKTILIIEDNEADQYLWELLLLKTFPDIQILKAFDGEEALEVMRGVDKDPDLILLDINMPKMSGHQFLESFTDNNTKEIPVVVMLTSSNLPKDKDQALAYKCVKDYMLKPIKKENLETLEALVAAHSA